MLGLMLDDMEEEEDILGLGGSGGGSLLCEADM